MSHIQLLNAFCVLLLLGKSGAFDAEGQPLSGFRLEGQPGTLDRASWGRGLATEASTAVIDYAFDELGFRELLASTDPPNRASIRVMERLGMRFLEAARTGGLPIVFYRIDRDEWSRRRGRSSPASMSKGAER